MTPKTDIGDAGARNRYGVPLPQVAVADWLQANYGAEVAELMRDQFVVATTRYQRALRLVIYTQEIQRLEIRIAERQQRGGQYMESTVRQLEEQRAYRIAAVADTAWYIAHGMPRSMATEPSDTEPAPTY